MYVRAVSGYIFTDESSRTRFIVAYEFIRQSPLLFTEVRRRVEQFEVPGNSATFCQTKLAFLSTELLSVIETVL